MTRRADRPGRLAQIADLKAAIAKGAAAKVKADADALAARINTLRDDRQAMALVTPDPASARAHGAWLRHCDQQLRSLRAEQARAKAVLDSKLDRARYEEGRRQALDRLKTQAS